MRAQNLSWERQRCGIVVIALLAEKEVVLLHISLLIKINILSPWKWSSGFIFSLNPEIILFRFLIWFLSKLDRQVLKIVTKLCGFHYKSEDNSYHSGSSLPLFGTPESLLTMLQGLKNVALFFKVDKGASSLNFLYLRDSLRNDPYQWV